MLCAYASGAWREGNENEKADARKELEELLLELASKQRKNVRIESVKWAQISRENHIKTYTIRFTGRYARSSHDCRAKIVETRRNQILDLTCENLEFRVERNKSDIVRIF